MLNKLLEEHMSNVMELSFLEVVWTTSYMYYTLSLERSAPSLLKSAVSFQEMALYTLNSVFSWDVSDKLYKLLHKLDSE